MAAIGSAIGLGAIWRFPYMAYANGGGAFFIPYMIALFTTGIPLLSLEYYLGCRYQNGPTQVYGFIRKKSNPLGWFAIFSGAMILCYYTIVMAWALNYLSYSFGIKWAGNEEAFFFSYILGRTEHIGCFGNLQCPVVIGNFITWALMYMIISRGIKMIGRVINWFVILPWVLLLILIVRGMTLPGASHGLDFYLKPDLSLLLEPGVWLAAYGQIFFSLSLGFGVMVAYASYLPKDADIHTDAWVVSFANCLTAYFAGFAVFSAIGYVAVMTGQPIDSIAEAGPGLAFIVYPTAIAQLPGGIIVQSVFGLLFFLMLLAIGIDSAFSLVEAMVTGFKDSFNLQRKSVTFWVCVAGFTIGLFYAWGSGIYWLDIVDHWMNWSLILVGLVEAVLIGWFFNVRKASADIDATSRIKFGRLWTVAIKYVTPTVLTLILISNIVDEFNSPYGNYPVWSLMIAGWFLITAIMAVSIYMPARSALPYMQDRHARLVAWAIIHIGVLVTCCLCYTTDSLVSPLIMITGTLFTGCSLLRALNRLDLPYLPKQE